MGLQDRLKNNLINGEEQVKKAVEQGQIKVTDTEKKIYDAASKVVDTTPLDNNSDAAPEVDDTSSQDNKDFNLGDGGYTLDDPAPIGNSAGPMMFLGENLGDALPQLVSDGGDAFNQVTDTIGDGAAQVVSDGAEVVSDGAEAAKKTVDKTVNNLLPANIGKNLGLALYGILAVAAIAVFLYILSLLKPIFQIGANVSDK